MGDAAKSDLDRARRLLAPEATGIELQEGGMLADADAIGARGGLGLKASRPDVHVSVYAFESQADHAAAVEALQKQAPADASYVLSSSNGALLFFGYADTTGASGDPVDAEERLDTLIQAFSGEE